MGVSLVVTAWVARYLGAQKYGYLNYSIAFVSLFTPLVSSGIDNVIVQNLAIDSNEKESILGTAMCLKIMGSILSIILSIFSISLLRSEDPLTIFLVAIVSTSFFFSR
jgi:PST family polysaccharide transporter